MNDSKLRAGTKHCLCAECGEYFTTAKNFDLHRRSVRQKRVCLDPGRIVDKGGKARLRRNPAGLWTSAEPAYIPESGR